MNERPSLKSNPSVDLEGETQRIDKWLWCARFFKTRSLASKFVSGGQMRLTRDGQTQRISKPSFMARPTDELAFAIGARLWIIEINHCAARRGPASEASSLYKDHSPPPAAKTEGAAGENINAARQGVREKGSGRPTKKDRRAISRLQTD